MIAQVKKHQLLSSSSDKTTSTSTEPLAGDVKSLGLPMLGQGEGRGGLGKEEEASHRQAWPHPSPSPPSPALHLLHTWSAIKGEPIILCYH